MALFMPKLESITLSVIVPCFNESHVLPQFQAELTNCLNSLKDSWEIIFVDDGSEDTTLLKLKEFNRIDSRYKLVRLSRNFGQQLAILAGISYSTAEVVAILDADLQDPPELLKTCLAKLKEGFDLVYTVRKKRKENALKRLLYSSFYRILNLASQHPIPNDSGDFCVMTRQVAEVLKKMPEFRPFLRGLRAWSGFRQARIEFERDYRAAGHSKYTLRKLSTLAMDGILGFSNLPLRLATLLGIALLLGAVGLIALTLIWYKSKGTVWGYRAVDVAPSIFLLVAGLILSALQLLFLGLIGEYIVRIYQQSTGRPRWIVSETVGIHLLGESRDNSRT